MGNDDGLDLGLGLSCGRSFSKSYAKEDNPPDICTNDEEKTSNVSEDFRSFHRGAVHFEDTGNESLRLPEKFFDMLPRDGNTSAEVEENLLVASNKRKSFFEDLNHQKKHEYGATDGVLNEKTKTPHISLTTTDEGSTADNKDVVDSEVDGSMSRFAADHDTNTKQQSEGGASSGAQKQAHGHNNSGAGQMGFSVALEGGPKTWINMNDGQYEAHSMNVCNMPISSTSLEFGRATMPGRSDHPLYSAIHTRPNASWDQPVTPSNISMAFGYAPFQAQQSGKEQPWSMLPRPQHLYPPFAIRPTLGEVAGSEKHNDALKLPQGSGQVHLFNTLESSMQDGTGIQPAKGVGNQVAEEIPMFSSTFATLTPAEGISSLGSAIWPGISADLKFDGTGSFPNLPWVSTKGSGPNGKAISGVTYRFSPNQIKIVCACHGSHMTPDEFVRHADDENSKPTEDTSTIKSSLPSNNKPATSAQS